MISVTIIRDPQDADQLHDILHEAFLPFKDFYTKEAFNATVVSSEILKERIASNEFTVYGGKADWHLAATVSTQLMKNGNLYFMSMAVAPNFSGRGLGRALLNAIETEAKSNKSPRISLWTYAPLLQAITLYENSGFIRTTSKRDYSGIEVFEMAKNL